MVEKNEEHPLRELLAKINHPLLDIRSRSLRSVSFKLSTGLLHIADMVHERDFLSHLLEWFNFEEVVMEAQALSLISQVAEHEAAAQILVEIGGVEFLSQLRLHSDPSLQPLIDEVLEQLLKLPQSAADTLDSETAPPKYRNSGVSLLPLASANPPSDGSNGERLQGDSSDQGSNHKPSDQILQSAVAFTSSGELSQGSSSQQTFTTESTTDYGSYLQISRQSFGLTDDSSPYTGLPPQYLERTFSGTQSSASGSHSLSSVETAESQRFGMIGERSQPCFPYTVSPAGPSSLAHEIKSEGSARTEPDGQYFPWLKLSLNDRHILATTDSRLQGSTADGLIKSCEFIQDVLFQDFPAELFLQRPSLLKSLLKLLVHGGAEGTHHTVLHCLLELTAHLHQRLALLSDPAMGVTDQLTLPAMISKQVKSSRTAPDHLLQSHDLSPQSHDLPLQSCDLPPQSHDLEQLTEDMLLFLQSEQVSLEQYCHSVIASVTPLLLGYLNRHIPQLRGDGDVKGGDSSGSCRPLPVYIAICLQLLGAVVDLLEQLSKHTGTTHLSQKNDTLGIQNLESLASVLSQCLSKWRRFGTPAQSSCPQLQLVCWTTLHLAVCLGKLLDIQGPHTSGTIPASTASVLHDLMMNGVLAVASPQLQQTLQPNFDKLDTADSALLQKIKQLSTAFERMSSFLSCVQHSGDHPHESLVQLATEGLPGLWFHCNEDFTTASLKLCIGILMSKGRSSEWNSASTLLLKLLSHESDSVKELAYKHLKDSVLEGLADLKQHPTETAHTSSITVLPLILNKEVLEEVCCHGSVSKVVGVASAACEILGSLVHLREELFRPELLEMLLQWMPYIEVCMSTNESVCKCVRELLGSKEAGISDAVRLQSHLRLLFSTSTELRVWSFTELSKLLLSEDGGKLSPFSSPTSVALHDILTLGEKRAVQSVHDIHRSGTFKPDDVVKLLHILRSPAMDNLLKKTALEQLAILLNDRSLHEPALGEGIIADLILALRIALQRREDSESQSEEETPLLLKPCIKCLQLLAHSGATLREELVADCSFLLDVLRATLLLHKDMESLCSASKLLACLLFAPVSTFPSPGGGMRLPESLLNRLRIPWQVDPEQSESSHSTLSPLAPSLLSSDPALSMLRLHYHVAMQGGVEKLLKAQDFVAQSHADSEKLKLPSGDLKALKATHLQTSCIECFKILQAASSHDGVTHLLHSLSVLLQVCGITAKGLKTASVDGGLQLEWNQVLERFLTVQPTTPEDVSLLTSVLQFVYDLLGVPASAGLLAGPAQLESLVRTTAGRGTVCLQLLHSSLQCVEHRHSIDPYRCLQKILLKFLSSLTKRMASEPDSSGSFDPLALIEALCQCLDVAGSPNYYDLPILESSLECLLHLTASSCMKRTSTPEWMALSMKLMTSLRQVLWSFISGRGSMLASFMGKGVTSRAALSLCHLLQASSRLSPPEGWWTQWVQSAPDVGLSWLHSLVEDREPQVQYAGMSMLATLCTLTSLVELVLGDWAAAGHAFGLWGACLQTALGQECSLVRQQAFFVLVSLSALCSKEKKWDQYLTYNSDEVSVHGLKALELLLESYKFFPTLQTLVQTQSLSKLKEKTPLIRRAIDSCLMGQLPKYGKGDVIRISEENCECLSEVLQEVLRCCDPHVMTGACKLVHNLLLAFPESLGVHVLTHSTIGTLISVVDFQLVGVFLVGDNSSTVSPFQRSSWVRMCTDAVSLLKVAAVVLQPDATLPHLLREGVVVSLCKVVSLVRALESCMEDPECLSLCSAVLALLQVTVERASSSKAEVVFCSLQLHWSSFTGLLHHSLRNASTSGSTLRANSLRLFCSLLVHRFQPDTGRTAGTSGTTNSSREPLVVALGQLLDGRGEHHPGGTGGEGDRTTSSLSTDSESGTLEQPTATQEAPPTGSILCEALLKCCDWTFSRIPVQTQSKLNAEGRQLVGESLGILLACSTAAKQTALSAGLLESTTEQLKTLHSKLCMESLEQVAHQSQRGKESALISEIISLVNLLRSFMYTSAEVKLAALGCHLPAVVHKLWPWCTVTRRLLLAVLKLLTCFTAQHARGQASLASSVVKGASNSLLHSVIKLATHSITGYNSCSASKMANPHAEVLRAVFALLANCALSSECRGVMKKTAFLSGFTSVNPNSEKGAHGRTRLSVLWLRLLINLSFSAEGQHMLVKLPGSIDVLLDIHQHSNPENQTQCLLILRNLCFFGPSKTLLVSNENFLRLLSIALESGDKKEIALAASAVWALLHNCSKIKNSLKKSELAEKLGNIYLSMKPEQPTTTGTGPITDELLCRTAVTHAQTLLH